MYPCVLQMIVQLYWSESDIAENGYIAFQIARLLGSDKGQTEFSLSLQV